MSNSDKTGNFSQFFRKFKKSQKQEKEIIKNSQLHKARHSQTSSFSGLCIEEDTDYLGNDIKHSKSYSHNDWHIPNVENPTHCQTLCQENRQCKFWTFGLTEHKGHCWLKTSASGRKKHPGLISGPKNCRKSSSSQAQAKSEPSLRLGSSLRTVLGKSSY